MAASVSSSSLSVVGSNSEHSAATQPSSTPTSRSHRHDVKAENGAVCDSFQQTHAILKQEEEDLKEEEREMPPQIDPFAEMDSREMPPQIDPFEVMDSTEYTKRYDKMHNEYTERLMSKYFSNKDFFGDDIYGTTVFSGKAMKGTRLHPASSYADPVQFLENKKKISSRPAETQTSSSNGKLPAKPEKK